MHGRDAWVEIDEQALRFNMRLLRETVGPSVKIYACLKIDAYGFGAGYVAKIAASEGIGYPIMLKAASGGGGKGMRLVHSADEMDSAWERARSEAKKFFGDDTVYLEKAILSPRHVEIQVVGDRFVFQSEVLFPKGSAVMDFTGNLEMDKLAIALNELEQEIPPDISWVLRVDGHTDADPIQTTQFKSNWELSAARAIEVVKYLVSKGVSPEHLVAAGFGEFQPIDPGTDEEAKTRNRRIELKLTER